MPKEPLIPPHGGYRNLKTFQLAQLVYDLTARFCDRYIDKRSRTHDQMVQAARSGVQNIVEGSQASGTSSKFEIKLTSVARASLEELRMDYEDYLRQRGLPLWEWSDPRRKALVARRCKTAEDVAAWVREIHDGNGPYGRNGQYGKDEGAQQSRSISSIQSIASPQGTYPELAANAALILIGVTSSLLERQLAAQATSFEEQGGFSERMHRVRSDRRRDPG